MHEAGNRELWDIRVLASEGRYDFFRLLTGGRRAFLATKLTLTAFNYWRGKSGAAKNDRIALIKGPNQLRHHNRNTVLREADIGHIEPLFATPSSNSNNLFPRIHTREFLALTVLAALVLLRGRRRDVLTYLLVFYRAMKRIVSDELKELEVFICYNDQAFDVAGIVQALNRRGGCRTIVIQHGLILSPDFYFPANAQEFWAWGKLSQLHFRTRNANGKMKIYGRYIEDRLNKKNDIFGLPERGPIRILVAFSFDFNEVKSGLLAIAAARRKWKPEIRNRIYFHIKLHPATKNKWLVRSMIRRRAGWLQLVDGDMEDLVSAMDGLLTLNSTSAVEFLICGKPVIVLKASDNPGYPSKFFGFSLDDLTTLLHGNRGNWGEKKHARSRFLKAALNV